MNQSRETMSGANDDWQLSSVFDNSNTFSDELDSIIMADWDDARGSMMLDWPFDDQKLVPDSSQIGDQIATTGTQCFSGCDPSLQASQDAMTSGTTGINVPHNGIAPLSDMFASHLELDQSFIDPELFKRSPVLMPNYTVPIFPGSTYQQFPATSAPFPSRLLNDEMYENTVLRMFPPPQDLPVLAQKLIDSSMMEKAIVHSGKPTTTRTEEAFDDAALQRRGSAQSMIKTDNGIDGVGHPSTIIGDRQGAAARIVRPARETPVVIGASVKDGYNWRKYGQKNMKDSNFPRSYYRCTYPHCKTTKKEERSPQGFVTEIIYKGVHNHPKPNPFPCPSSYPKQGVRRNASQQKQHGTHFSSKMSSDHVVEGDDADSDRQKKEFNALETMRSSSRSPRQVKYLVLVFADFDVIDDGYRWRKYGSKVVKGNTNPRSYYKCTDPGCKARKLVERSPDDCKKLMSTYEGTHNHEVPGPKKGSSSSSNNNTSSSAISSSSARPSSLLPQANGSLAPRTELAARDNFMRFGCPSPLGIVSLPRSLPTLPAAVNPLGMVAVAPLPTRMRMPILPQLSSYPGFRAPLQSGLTTMVIPKLDPTDQHPPSETQQLALQPAGDGAATSRPRN